MNSYAVRQGLKLLLSVAICSVSPADLSTSPSSAPVRTTLCNLQTHPEAFSGRMVRVRTTIVTNFEMSMLHDDSCPVSNVHVWFGNGTIGPDAAEYAIVDSSEALSRDTTIQWQRCPVVTLAQSKETRAMFRKMRKQEKRQGYGSAIATVLGLFQHIPADKMMALKGADGRIWKTSGFGHELCCNARLLPREIQGVTVTPKSNR